MPPRYAATVVVPLLRQRAAWLAQSVRSALTQTVPCEVIVVTSPATPAGNLAVLADLRARWPNLGVRPQARAGFGAAINTGIAAATTERLGLLLSDDWLEPDAVAACLPAAADIVSTARRCYAADGRRELRHLRRPSRQRELERRPSLEARARYLTHFFLFRREKLLAVGGVDETLGDPAGIDDYDLIWVLLEHGATVRVVERMLYNYRDHDGERLTLRAVDEIRATLIRILAKHGVTSDAQAAIVAHQSRWFGRPLSVVATRVARRRSGARVPR